MPDEKTPMTEEQLDFFSYQTRRAVSHALRHYGRRALAAYLLVVAASGYAVYDARHQASEGRQAIVISGRNVATDSCNARFGQQLALRKIVASGRPTIKQYVKEGTLTQAQADRALAENRKTVKSLKLPDCRLVGRVLTDNLENLRPNQPKPLYPGSPDLARRKG